MIEFGGYGCRTFIENCVIDVDEQPWNLPNDGLDYYCPECLPGSQMMDGECYEIAITGCLAVNEYLKCVECQEGWLLKPDGTCFVFEPIDNC